MDKLERRFTTYQKFALVTSAHHHIWIYLGVSAEILEPGRNSWYYAAISTHPEDRGGKAQALKRRYIMAHTLLPLDFKWRFPPV